MLLSIGLPNFGSYVEGDWRRLVELGRIAEAAGCDRLVVVDHVVLGPDVDDYRWGRFPTAADGPWLEPLAVLSALAGATSSITLATGILIAGLRPGALLAKQAATVDVLSDGRLELGVGIGWQPKEYEALGLDWAERGSLLSEVLSVCHTLWSELPATVETSRIHATDVYCMPRPVQEGGVPFLLAGTLAARTVERIVRFGTGWLPIMGASVRDVTEGVSTLRAAFADAGRPIDDLRVVAALAIVRDGDGRVDLDATIDGAAALAGAGATAVNVPLQVLAPDPDTAPEVLERAVRRFAQLRT